MAKRRSQLVVYESQYLVDPISQNQTSQSDYKLSCGEIGDSRRKHFPSRGSEKKLWMALLSESFGIYIPGIPTLPGFVSLREIDTSPMTYSRCGSPSSLAYQETTKNIILCSEPTR